ncbi:hypothetical protein MHB77_30415 [Paenibacillus sp. FSL K6-3166]|uniref:hypothetical protein n=1 Tax=Paenibacillus sp. FSL K6-3166 TaxID=2921492 RepID=UPI0030F6BBBD
MVMSFLETVNKVVPLTGSLAETVEDRNRLIYLSEKYSSELSIQELLKLCNESIEEKEHLITKAEETYPECTSRNLRGVIFQILNDEGISKEEFSQKLGVSLNDIDLVFKGMGLDNPNLSNLYKMMCEYFKLDPQYYLHTRD